MAKKKDNSAAIASPMSMDDRYRVEDGVRTALNYHAMCDDKPLFRKVRKQVRTAARKMGGRGGSR